MGFKARASRLSEAAAGARFSEAAAGARFSEAAAGVPSITGAEAPEEAATDPFAEWHLNDIGAMLALALSGRRVEAQTEAIAMTPSRGGPGYRVSIYRESNTFPAQHHAFALAYPAWADFIAALTSGEPAAIEAGVEVLSRVDPSACLPIALQLVGRTPWNLLWDCVARALSRADDEAAFRALLQHNRCYNVSLRIGTSQFSGGANIAMTALRTNPAVRCVDYDRRDTMFAEGLIRYLARHANDAIWDVLIVLWRGTEDTHLRLACGHVMLASELPRCLQALEDSIPNRKSRGRFFGVRAVVARDDANVFKRLGGLAVLTKPRGRAVAVELLEIVSRGRPMEHMRAAVERLRKDSRMLELAMAWIHEPECKDVAQRVVDLFPRARALPPVVKVTPPAQGELDTMRGIMEVARQNFERIIYVLRGHDYQFARPDSILGVATEHNRDAIGLLETAIGPLPAALRAAYEIIVHIDLRGTAPLWPKAADPFVLQPADSLVDDAQDHTGDIAQYTLALSGDALAKDGYSAGSYNILVPSDQDDPALTAGEYTGTLLGYLRHTFNWGGFPGLAQHDTPPQLLNALRGVCVPI